MVTVEEEQPEIQGKKRTRVESVHSEPDSPQSKRVHREEEDSGALQTESRRVDDDATDSGVILPRTDQIPEDLLGILSDSDELTDRDPAIQDLDPVIKSLEDEINQPPETEVSPTSQPDLGYLLEASDDELGLPPATSSPAPAEGAQNAASDIKRPEISSDEFNFGKMFEFDDQLPSYELGLVEEEETPSGEFVLDELFPCNERQPSDQSELPWQRRLAADPAALTG